MTTPSAPPAGPSPHADLRALLVARAARMAAFGASSVVLALHLESRGFHEASFGLLVTLTLVGDAALTLAFGTLGVRWGQKRVLVGSAALLALVMGIFAIAEAPVVLWVTATIGILSPSGGEVGPSGAIEQASLANLVTESERPRVYAWYNLLGSVAVALGSKAGGSAAQVFGTETVFAACAVLVVLGSLPLARVSPRIESSTRPPKKPLEKSRKVIARLSTLFALDSFGSGLVMQSALAYWLRLRFGFSASALGTIFLVTNLLSAASALLAARLAVRIGLVRTMVFSHVPANLFLLGLAFAPTKAIAITLVCCRFVLAQMDVPARMALVMRIVPEEERAQAATVTALARSGGNALGPVVTGAFLAARSFQAPVVLASVVKIAYDLGLYRAFRAYEAGQLAQDDDVPRRKPREGEASVD